MSDFCKIELRYNHYTRTQQNTIAETYIMPITLGPIFNQQNGKVREWSITIALYDSKDKSIGITSIDDDINIKSDYYASYSTLSGYTGMKMTNSDPTIVSIGKNLGRKNETNVLTQAYKECQSKYALKIKSGYTIAEPTKTKKETNHSGLPFPMAVKSWKDHKAKLQYPLYIQPKLDGIRMLAKYDRGSIKLITRRLHDITGFEKVKNELKTMFESSGLKSFYIDGELYSHGVNLQTISGIVRNESIDESVKETLQYHVFDCFDVNQPKLTFRDRVDTLTTFVNSSKSNMVVLTPTMQVTNDGEATNEYQRLIKDGFEGTIYKSSDRPYDFDFNKEKRSAWYLKRKKQEDAEFPVVGYTQGKGKDLGCIVFVLQGPNDKTFNCVPNGTYDYRKELYAKAVKSFKETFEGILVKVVYDDLSKDGVPLRGRIVQIGRDLQFD